MRIMFGCTITLLTFAMLISLPDSFAVEAPPENLVRATYFLPNDRQPQAGIDAKLDALIIKVQQSYTEVIKCVSKIYWL